MIDELQHIVWPRINEMTTKFDLPKHMPLPSAFKGQENFMLIIVLSSIVTDQGKYVDLHEQLSKGIYRSAFSSREFCIETHHL